MMQQPGWPSRSSIDMHTAQEEVASTTRHHSAIMNLTLGAAAAAAGTLLAAGRCTVADGAINAPACVGCSLHSLAILPCSMTSTPH
jgi:hypothetical protein